MFLLLDSKEHAIMENLLSSLNLSAENASLLINASKNVNYKLIESFQRNSRIEAPYYAILIVTYSIIITFGAVGNSLVVAVVCRRPIMRTVRNMFIVNLAVSGK